MTDQADRYGVSLTGLGIDNEVPTTPAAPPLRLDRPRLQHIPKDVTITWSDDEEDQTLIPPVQLSPDHPVFDPNDPLEGPSGLQQIPPSPIQPLSPLVSLSPSPPDDFELHLSLPATPEDDDDDDFQLQLSPPTPGSPDFLRLERSPVTPSFVSPTLVTPSPTATPPPVGFTPSPVAGPSFTPPTAPQPPPIVPSGQIPLPPPLPGPPPTGSVFNTYCDNFTSLFQVQRHYFWGGAFVEANREQIRRLLRSRHCVSLYYRGEVVSIPLVGPNGQFDIFFDMLKDRYVEKEVTFINVSGELETVIAVGIDKIRFFRMPSKHMD